MTQTRFSPPCVVPGVALLLALTACVSTRPDAVTNAGTAPPPVGAPAPHDSAQERVLIRHVNPEYPSELRKRRIAGDVVVEAVIDRDGVPKRVRVIESDHPELSDLALSAARQWRFAAASPESSAEELYRTTVHFRIADQFPYPLASRGCREGAGWLQGSVTRNGQGVEGALVHKWHATSDVVQEARTDARGLFSFGCVTAEFYTLAVVRPSRSGAGSRQIRVSANKIIEVPIALPAPATDPSAAPPLR